ncbi:MAG: hypothetical protein ACKODZ_08430, partial [Verrucomicrobiota bacterium]
SVTYELVNAADSSKVSISGGVLRALSGTGSVQVRAVTAGDNNYDVASAIQTITLGKAGQSVNFTLPSSLTYDTTASLGATVTGAGSVTYELVNAADSSKVSISGGVLRALSGTGSVQVRAVTAGDQNYNSALAEQTISLAKAVPMLSAQGAGTTANGNLVASLAGQFGGGVTFSALETDGRVLVNSTTGSVSLGRTLASSATINLIAAGNDNYLGGSVDLPVSLAGPTLTQREAANPARRLLRGPGSNTELEALDRFFFYQAKASDFTGDSPSAFFTMTHQPKNLSLGQVESLGRLTQLYAGQTSDYFFMGNLTAGAAAILEINLQNRDRVIYADTIRIDPAVASATTLSDFPYAIIPDGNLAGLARNLDLSSQGLSTSFSWFVD